MGIDQDTIANMVASILEMYHSTRQLGHPRSTTDLIVPMYLEFLTLEVPRSLYEKGDDSGPSLMNWGDPCGFEAKSGPSTSAARCQYAMCAGAPRCKKTY